jgi:hypothetical protein
MNELVGVWHCIRSYKLGCRRPTGGNDQKVLSRMRLKKFGDQNQHRSGAELHQLPVHQKRHRNQYTTVRNHREAANSRTFAVLKAQLKAPSLALLQLD